MSYQHTEPTQDDRDLAWSLMDALYHRQEAAGFKNTCCYDFGTPIVAAALAPLRRFAERVSLENSHTLGCICDHPDCALRREALGK